MTRENTIWDFSLPPFKGTVLRQDIMHHMVYNSKFCKCFPPKQSSSLCPYECFIMVIWLTFHSLCSVATCHTILLCCASGCTSEVSLQSCKSYKWKFRPSPYKGLHGSHYSTSTWIWTVVIGMQYRHLYILHFAVPLPFLGNSGICKLPVAFSPLVIPGSCWFIGYISKVYY